MDLKFSIIFHLVLVNTQPKVHNDEVYGRNVAKDRNVAKNDSKKGEIKMHVYLSHHRHDVADLREALRDIHIALPIAGADQEDYLVRNLTGIDMQRGLIGISEAVADGDRAMFCRRDRTTAAEDLERMAKDARRRLGRPPRGALYVSCLARGPSSELLVLRSAQRPSPSERRERPCR